MTQTLDMRSAFSFNGPYNAFALKNQTLCFSTIATVPQDYDEEILNGLRLLARPFNGTFLLCLLSARPLDYTEGKDGAAEVGTQGLCGRSWPGLSCGPREAHSTPVRRGEGRRRQQAPSGAVHTAQGTLTWDGLRDDDSGGAVPGRNTVSGSRLNDTRFLAVGLGGHRWS